MSREAELFRKVVELERILADKDAEISSLELSSGLDLFSDSRELLTKERAEELFKSITSDMESVRLGTKSFGQDASLIAAEKLSTLAALQVADLSDIIAGRPEAEALQVLQTICGALPSKTLRRLDLSENALGEKGIRALEQTLRRLEGLEDIRFANNGLSELSIQLLADFLPVENLKVLQFHNNMSGSGGAIAAAKILDKCKVLEDFRMSSSRVRADGGLPLIHAVCGLSDTLVKLNLADSMFDEECTEVLVEGLKKMKKLKVLILRDTGVDKDVLLPVLQDPLVLPELSVLDLSGLEIDADSAEQVGKIVRSRPKLRKLWLDDNELESEGAVKFVVAASNQSSPSLLEFLSVQSNQIGQQGAFALVKFAVAHPLMKRLELNDNQISSDGVDKIQQLLASKGKQDVLGSLEENADEDDEDEELEDQEDDQADDLDALTASLNKKLTIDD